MSLIIKNLFLSFKGKSTKNVFIDTIEGFFNVHCGGSIYNKTTIITAGHCCDNFDDPNNFPLSDTRIIAGQLEISSSYGQGYINQVDHYLLFRNRQDFVI